MNNDKQSHATNEIFTITCKDILLREYVMEDVDSLCELTQQAEIKEFLPDWNASRENRLYWMQHYEIVDNKKFLQAVADGGEVGDIYLRLAIILKETGEFIGWCCSGIKEELPPPNREIVYAISNRHANKGYTTQAVEGMITYLFENTDVEVLNAVALVRNIPSNKVIQKCGFEFVGTVEIDQEINNHYRISKR